MYKLYEFRGDNSMCLYIPIFFEFGKVTLFVTKCDIHFSLIMAVNPVVVYVYSDLN